MTQKKTELRDMTIDQNGCCDININLLNLDDDGKIINGALHIISLNPDTDYDIAFNSANKSITNDLGFPAISDADKQRVITETTVIHTKAVKDAWTAFIADAAKRNENLFNPEARIAALEKAK
jgi:hypothetical protein